MNESIITSTSKRRRERRLRRCCISATRRCRWRTAGCIVVVGTSSLIECVGHRGVWRWARSRRQRRRSRRRRVVRFAAAAAAGADVGSVGNASRTACARDETNGVCRCVGSGGGGGVFWLHAIRQRQDDALGWQLLLFLRLVWMKKQQKRKKKQHWEQRKNHTNTRFESWKPTFSTLKFHLAPQFAIRETRRIVPLSNESADQLSRNRIQC